MLVKVDGKEEKHTFKFFNKADLAFWHQFMKSGGCGASYFCSWCNISKDTAGGYDKVILPASATHDQFIAAGGSEKVYKEWDFDYLASEAALIAERSAELRALGSMSKDAIHRKVLRRMFACFCAYVR